MTAPDGGAGDERHPSVGIVGAGIAGLTAALRLAERGFAVTVYERNPFVGGLLSAHRHGDGAYHEHCYHMFLGWYHNFWSLIGDIGLSRDRDFEPRDAIRYMRVPAGSDGPAQTFTLYGPGIPERFFDNFFSGVAPPPDLFLSAYSLIDLLTQQFRPGRLLDQYSVNSFMQSRPYATEQSAILHDYTLARAFALPSYMTSAASYKSFVKYSFREPDPMLWVLRGDAEQALHRPLTARLKELGCEIKLGCEVTAVERCAPEGPDGAGPAVRIVWKPTGPGRGDCYVAPKGIGALVPTELDDSPAVTPAPWAPALERGESAPRRHDYVILAVPPGVLQSFLAPESMAARSGSAGPPVPTMEAARFKAPAEAEAALRLPRLLKLQSEPMAALDLSFTRRLPDIPTEHVVLMDSEFGLSFIDNSQTWGGGDRTVLNVIASDFKSLANLKPFHAVTVILAELARFVPFDETDIDWDQLHFQTNIGDKLFINEVGSEAYRPGPTTENPSLFLAGDFCRTPIDVVTVEAAVVSGLQAARALQIQAMFDGCIVASDRRGRLVEVVEPQAHPDAYLVMLKAMLAPYVPIAKAWSWAHEQLVSPPAGTDASDVVAAWSNLLVAPWAAAAMWWRTGWDLWQGGTGPTRGGR